MVEFLWWDAIGQDYARFTQNRITNKYIPSKHHQKRQQSKHSTRSWMERSLPYDVLCRCCVSSPTGADLIPTMCHLFLHADIGFFRCELCLAKTWQERVKIRLPNRILTPLNSNRTTRYSYWNFTLYLYWLDTGSTFMVAEPINDYYITHVTISIYIYTYYIHIQDLFCDSFCDSCQLTWVDVRFQERASLIVNDNDAKCSPLLARDKFQAWRWLMHVFFLRISLPFVQEAKVRVSWSLPSLPKLEDIKDLFRQIMPPQARHLFF